MDPVAEAKTVSDFLDALKNALSPSELAWYRGQANLKWSLAPSLEREARYQGAEVAMLKFFKQRAHPFLDVNPASEWEWLFLAQHHEMPTRLLDWSENPLMGLYFAAQSDLEEDGGVWILRPYDLNAASGIPLSHQRELFLFGEDTPLDTYLPSMVAVQPHVTAAHVAGIASRNFSRIISQQGTFTTACGPQDTLDEYHNGAFVDVIRIPVGAKPDLRVELATLGVSVDTVYPSLATLGRKIREMF